MDKVYLLQHSYEVIYEGASFDETKLIGIYSSREKAEEVVERYKKITGFNKYPSSCFYIADYELDQDNWTEGFVGSDEIREDFEILTSCFNEWLNIMKTPEESWEDDNYYNALWDINREVYNMDYPVQLAAYISRIWSVRFMNSPKSVKECMKVATKVLQSLKLRD